VRKFTSILSRLARFLVTIQTGMGAEGQQIYTLGVIQSSASRDRLIVYFYLGMFYARIKVSYRIIICNIDLLQRSSVIYYFIYRMHTHKNEPKPEAQQTSISKAIRTIQHLTLSQQNQDQDQPESLNIV
jgi:hypothetical protein